MDQTFNVVEFEVRANGRTKVFDVERYPEAEDWFFAQKGKAEDVTFKAVIDLDD